MALPNKANADGWDDAAYFVAKVKNWISFFINAVSNKRADTLKEAINLYEEHLHKLRMEEMQQNQMLAQQATLEATQEQLAATKEQNAKLATIEKKSIQTAKAAKATAFISAYSAYNTRKIAKK